MRFFPLRALSLCLFLLSLGGCSGLLPGSGKPDRPQTASESLPAAKPLNAATARSLFLIIVEGLHKDGRSRAALAYLDEYEQVYPGDPKAQMLRADCLVDLGRTAPAAALYRQQLGSETAAAAAYAGLGRIAAAQGNWTEAATDFRRASERNAANTSYLNDLGFAQLSSGTYADGLASLRQAHELDPGNAMIRNNLILALHLSGDDAAARAMVDRITQPDDRKRASDLLALTPAALHQAALTPPPVATATVTAQTVPPATRPAAAGTPPPAKEAAP